MATEGGGVPNRQRQPMQLVGWRSFFWEFDGTKPDGKTLWNIWISFKERHPKVFNAYYTVEDEYNVEEDTVKNDKSYYTVEDEYKVEEDTVKNDKGEVCEVCEGDEHDENECEGEGEDVIQDIDYVTAARTLQNIGAFNLLCYSREEIFHFLLFDLLEFVCTTPPPATIVFASGNSTFAPFLCKVKAKGYHVLVISLSERASSAFRDAGLTLYDWIPVVNGEGFFPSEERGLTISKKRDYSSLSKEEAH